MRRRSLVREDGQTRDEDVYVVASVITHPDYRRLGLAGFLMEEVARWIDSPEGGGTREEG
jgi:GNAT superfamily N-acetyltransferase